VPARSCWPSRSAQAVSQLSVAALVIGALACAAGAVTPPPSPPPPPPPPPPPANPWTQVWSDEFAGPAGAGVDTASWRYDTGDGCSQGNCGWGNNEKEHYSAAPENIALNGEGQLAIVARVAPAGLTCYYGACRYTSGKITTRGKISVSPGRVEARIKLAAGQGLWPAFWMLGENIGTVGWPTCGEIDILENRGSQPTLMSSAVHGPGYSGNTPFAQAHAISADSFHIYAVEWDSQSIRYFVDGRLHYAVTRTAVQRYGNWVFDQSFYLLLNQAVGGHFDGDPQSDAVFPATMLVDYVRVYRPARAQ
jgi:beta-glucanase (GH16 family)